VSGQWSALINLLKVVCDGHLEAYLAFKANNAAVFAENQLNESALEQKIKVLTLCSLGAQTANRVVSYEAISTALKIDVDEVELWVIEAISQNLIDGTIDQVNSAVTFS
jgi:translation initiation factor 3 subunit M